MTALSDLIKRLEEAEEGSRELDGEIHNALASEDERAEWVSPYQHTGVWGWYRSVEGYAARRCFPVLPFTTVLDAALALLPEEQNWALNTEPCGFFARTWWWETDVGGSRIVKRHDVCGQTLSKNPALAICIAALKARAALSQGEDK